MSCASSPLDSARHALCNLDLSSQYPNVSSVLEHCAQQGSYLSELTFYMRFYVFENQPITSGLFGYDPKMGFFEPEEYRADIAPTEERSWIFLVMSRIGEITGCGNFSTTFQNRLFFENTAAAEEAKAESKEYCSINALLNLIDNRPDINICVRLEWSARMADEWERNRPHVEAHNFHSYLIDIPAFIPGSAPSPQERPAFILQSLVNHFDSSVRRVNARTLRRHLTTMRMFDGETRVPSNIVRNWGLAAFWGAPLSKTRPTPIHSPNPDDYAEEHNLDNYDFGRNHGEDEVVQIDRFEVTQYDGVQALNRLHAFINQCFSQQSLDRQVPFAETTVRWSYILDLVHQANLESEERTRTTSRAGYTTMDRWLSFRQPLRLPIHESSSSCAIL